MCDMLSKSESRYRRIKAMMGKTQLSSCRPDTQCDIRVLCECVCVLSSVRRDADKLKLFRRSKSFTKVQTKQLRCMDGEERKGKKSPRSCHSELSP